MRQDIDVATMLSNRSAVEEEHARGVQLEVDTNTATKQVPDCVVLGFNVKSDINT